MNISMNGDIDSLPMYVRTGGSDTAAGHDGLSDDITKAYATISKAISGSFYGTSKPLIVSVGAGTFSDNKINVGARGLKIIG
jgi:hypothetical protein